MFEASINKSTPFWIFTLSLVIGLTLPTLIRDGMFMDALLYTSVSHNLSLGIGTFWFPKFSVHGVAGLPSFHEQPPLVFGIQALFFKMFGSSMYVERLYTLLTIVITFLLINAFWKELFKGNAPISKSGWLPILLWITIPVCFWSYSNNMHENTMGIFTLASVLLTYKVLSKKPGKLVHLIFAGSFIFLATLSKGFPGFFPIGVPLLYWLFTKRIPFSKAVLHTIIIVAIPLLGYLVLFSFPESNKSLSVYFFERALHRINELPTVDNRFYILSRLFMELLPSILLVIIILFISGLKKTETQLSKPLRLSAFFIAIGLSASAPLMLTLVQKGFYFVPALPFFAIGLSILIAHPVATFVQKINPDNKKFKTFFIISIILVIGAGTFTMLQIGKAGRDKETLHDVYLIGQHVPEFSVINIPEEIWNDWSLQCYLMRYYNISLSPGTSGNFYLTRQNSKPEDRRLKKADLNTQKYTLYFGADIP